MDIRVVFDALAKFAEQLLMIAGPFLAALAAKWLWAKAQEAVQYVNQNYGYDLNHAAELAVKAAEQLGLAKLLKGKKAYAIAIAQAYLDARGVKVSAAILEAAIEAAVLENFPHDTPVQAAQ